MSSLDQEIALRKLFVRALKKTGSEEAVFYADLFSFFGMSRSFSLAQVRELWRRRLSDQTPGRGGLHLQVDIPFCRQRCEFCDISKWIGSDAVVLQRYVGKIIEEMRVLQDVFSREAFDSFYFGNGSSELLRADAVGYVFREIRDNFVFQDQARKTFECNPSNTVFENLTVLKEFAINRVSFGVQSLDPEVLKAANRGYQTYDKVRRAVIGARTALGVENISADLMVGLYGDSPQTVCDSFIRLAELGVNSILIFPLVPNFYYLKKYYRNDKAAFDRELNGKLAGLEERLLAAARDYGYAGVSLKDAIFNGMSWDFVRQDVLEDQDQQYFFRSGGFQFDNLGIGSDSWSMISGVLYYTHRRQASFLECRFDAPDLYEGIAFTDSLYREFYVIRKLRDLGYLSLEEYHQEFGSDVLEDFSGPLKKLMQMGGVVQNGERLAFSAGSNEERFVRLLFFIGNERIADETQRILAQARCRTSRAV